MMNVAYLCLGGNIGNRQKALSDSLALIRECVGEIKVASSLYETEAWGVDNQQAYLNQCVCVHTILNANELIIKLLDIELQLGRMRTHSLEYEARTIDIDVLFFNSEIMNTEYLIIPHPRLHLRKFVLMPLHEIASNYMHPIFNKTITELLNTCADTLDVQIIH